MAKQKTYKRPLTQAQANACESAVRHVCRCRCHGLLHGISHKEFMECEQEVLEENETMSEDEMILLAQVIKEENLI